jgi:hypothetical protein
MTSGYTTADEARLEAMRRTELWKARRKVKEPGLTPVVWKRRAPGAWRVWVVLGAATLLWVLALVLVLL